MSMYSFYRTQVSSLSALVTISNWLWPLAMFRPIKAKLTFWIIFQPIGVRLSSLIFHIGLIFWSYFVKQIVCTFVFVFVFVYWSLSFDGLVWVWWLIRDWNVMGIAHHIFQHIVIGLAQKFCGIPDVSGCQLGHQSDGATAAWLFLRLNLEEETQVGGRGEGGRLCGCGESWVGGAARYVGWVGGWVGARPHVVTSLPQPGPASPAPPRLSTHQGMLSLQYILRVKDGAHIWNMQRRVKVAQKNVALTKKGSKSNETWYLISIHNAIRLSS